MKKGLVVLGVLVVAGAAAVYFFYFAPRMQQKAEREEHRQAIEHELAPLAAMMKAPDGATPCETAFNAFTAYDTTAKAQGSTQIVSQDVLWLKVMHGPFSPDVRLPNPGHEGRSGDHQTVLESI